MYRKKFIDKLRSKYQQGGVRSHYEEDINSMGEARKSLQQLRLEERGKQYLQTGGSSFQDGGYVDKAMSFGVKALKASPTIMGYLGRGAKALSPLGMMLGANKAYAPPVTDTTTGVNRFTGKQEYTPFGKTPSWGGGTRNVNAADVNQQLSAAMAPKINQTGGMYDQMQQYQGGGTKLPGGEMQPIPGSDAVQFNGASHDQGGIMLDRQTEVEGGETMDQVSMAKKGGKRDYFFSSHLKKGGRSYADMHKDILRDGGNQEEINMLARMQEQAAGRNPKQVAKLGGVMKYQTGGELTSLEDKYNKHEGNKPTPPTFDLTAPKTIKKLKANPNAVEERQYRLKTEDYQAKLEKFNAAKAEHEQAMSNYQTELSEWETTEAQLSADIEDELDMADVEAQEKKAVNDALVEEAKALNIPLAEIKTLTKGELRKAIKEEKAKQTKFQKQEGEEDVPKGQELVTIGGKEFYLDKKKDSRLYNIATTLGDKFGETWFKNADKEILDELGIESFDDLLADGANDSDIIRAYQASWNTKYPNDQIDYDGDLGQQTLLTGIDRQNIVDEDESRTLDEVTVKDERISKKPIPPQLLPEKDLDMQPIQPGPMPEASNTDRFDDAAKNLLKIDIKTLKDHKKAEDNLQYNDDTDEWEIKSQPSNLTIDRNRKIGPQDYNLKDDVLDGGVTETGDSSPEYTMITNPALTEQTAYTDSEGTEYTLDANNNWFEGDRQLDYDPSESGDLTKVEQKKDRGARIPWQATAGMVAGVIPAAYSLFHKQPAAEQAGYSPGFTNPIVAERGKAPRLARYDYNQDIADVGSDVRSMNKYIETSGGGPANMVNKMMAFSKGQGAKNKIRAAETRANIGVQNTEAQLKQQMTLDNLKRSQNASIFNAQMSRAESARKDQIDESNTARRQKRTDDMEFQKYAGMTSLGESLQQGFGDILDYKADMHMADAIGSDTGVYDRSTLAYLNNGGRGNLVWDEETKSYKESNKFGGLRRMRNYKK